MRDLSDLRTPTVPPGKGLYESLYLTATDPKGDRPLWLRHTWLKNPGAAPKPTAVLDGRTYRATIEHGS
jgi:hypothetical protein